MASPTVTIPRGIWHGPGPLAKPAPRTDDAPPTLTSRRGWRPDRRAAFAIAGLALPIVVASSAPAAIGGYLPTAGYDLLLSFTRMIFAYVLSLGFSLTYGYVAATNRSSERVLIPLLDILQSIPILGFFPVAIVFFVHLSPPGSWVGPNIAAIFLIFTSMSWNMVFGVYESLKSLPADMSEASASFGVRGWHRLRRLLLPATVNRLVYNSVLSWTGGWYFLVVAELIATSTPGSAGLPGIGSYLLRAASGSNWPELIAGLILLVGLIAALDMFVWRPAGRWAEKYRYDQSPSGDGDTAVSAGSRRTAPLRRAAGYVYHGVRTGVTRVATPLAGLAAYAAPARVRPTSPASRKAIRVALLGGVLVLAWLLLIFLFVGVLDVLTGPISPTVRHDISLIPVALAASFGRIVLAYGISLAIALPLAIFLVGRPRAYRLGLPLVEIVASVPATALFPLFIFALVPFIQFGGVAILLLITGMVWYLFFNLLSGLRSIPPDLEEAARSFGLPKRVYYRRLVFPAIFPALITGSITAFGGGWNTLIVAEYLNYSPTQSYSVVGIGQLIDVASNLHAVGYPLLVAALFAMVITVVAVNELLWKPLYRRAVEKFHFD